MIDCTNFSINESTPSKYDITHQCALFDFIVYTIFGGILVILGIMGNIISFIVLWYDSGKTATVFLLRCMSIADSLVLMTAVPLYVLPNVAPYTGYLKSYFDAYPNLVPFLWPSYLIPYTGTIMLTVLVSVNRYFCVCRPFASTKRCSLEGAYKQVAYVALFSIIYNIPRFFEYHKVEVCIANNKSIVAFDVSPFGNNTVYRVIYANVMYFIVMHGGPLVLLAFLNTQLIIALKKRQRKRTEMGKKSETGYQHDVTLVLVVVICVFMFCQTPTFIDHLFWTFLDDSERHCGNWHYYYTAIGDLLAMLNSSVNFVIYTLTSQRFRENLTSSCTNGNREFQRVPLTVANGAQTQCTGINRRQSPGNNCDKNNSGDSTNGLMDPEKQDQVTRL